MKRCCNKHEMAYRLIYWKLILQWTYLRNCNSQKIKCENSLKEVLAYINVWVHMCEYFGGLLTLKLCLRLFPMDVGRHNMLKWQVNLSITVLCPPHGEPHAAVRKQKGWRDYWKTDKKHKIVFPHEKIHEISPVVSNNSTAVALKLDIPQKGY